MKIHYTRIFITAAVLAAISFILTMIGISNAHAETCMSIDVQPSQVIGNYDGDTFTISLGALGQAIIRVDGVDTPEKTKKQAGWKEASDFTAQWLKAGPFKLSTCFVLTLGRIVANPSRNGVTLASELIAAGHVKPRP